MSKPVARDPRTSPLSSFTIECECGCNYPDHWAAKQPDPPVYPAELRRIAKHLHDLGEGEDAQDIYKTAAYLANRRMQELGITEQDVAETMPPKPEDAR